jgi:hypothetical protein
MGLPISFGRFTATFRLDAPLTLPPYAGSLFRGAFGWAIKRVVCVTRTYDCPPCLLRDRCVYPYIFETPPPANTQVMRKYTAAPHPFVHIPPDGGRTLAQGHTVELGLTLVGRAVGWLPHFIFALERMGRAGFGSRRIAATLVEVSGWIDGRRSRVYSVEDRTLAGAEAFTDRATVPRSPALDPHPLSATHQIAIALLSPLRIRYEERLAATLEFHILIRSLLRRLAHLSYFHCGGEPSAVAFRDWIDLAQQVRTVSSSLTWSDWTRYSTRQQTAMEFGGLTGRVVFEGPLDPFLPLLRLGEMVHAGKGTSFGLGRYRIDDVVTHPSDGRRAHVG